jgi:hypothetical protein
LVEATAAAAMRAAMTAATAARANRAAAATTLHQEEAEFDWPYCNRFFFASIQLTLQIQRLFLTALHFQCLTIRHFRSGTRRHFDSFVCLFVKDKHKFALDL